MNKKSYATIVAMGVMLAAGSASATELWDPHLRGVNEGLAAGALPPPGVYGVLDNYWAGYDQYNNSGKKDGVKLNALVEVPIVLWQTGIKVLGADYAVALAQPFDYTDLNLGSQGHFGTYNTIIIPGQLAWTLPNDFHVKAGLTVYADDASSSHAHPPTGANVGSGNGFWTVQPDLGFSWLSDGWNLSIDGHYAYNFADSKYHLSNGTTASYTSGGELAIDYTATKTIGKWTFGLGAHQENQLVSDSGAAANSALGGNCGANGGCKATNYGAGPLLGYQFTGVSIMGEFNQNIYAKNDVAGEIFNVRLVAPF